jgi:hypothetical protein
MNSKLLADTLNGWENNNQMMYSLEQEKLIHFKTKALREQRQALLQR